MTVESQIWRSWKKNYVLPDNAGQQWSLLEDIDEDTLVKTVGGNTEDIYNDDEDDEDPMEYEYYDESDCLYFKSARKWLIKLQELRKEAEKIAQKISVKKFYRNKKNNNDDTNMFEGWMDRAIHNIEMVWRRCTSDDFEIDYGKISHTFKQKDEWVELITQDSENENLEEDSCF